MFDLSFILTIGLILTFIGLLSLKFPAKSRNYFYGYRTKSSMKSDKAWNFSQIYSAKAMTISGVIQIFFGLIFWLLTKDETLLKNDLTNKQAYILIANFTIMFVGILIPIFLTEKKLKNYK